MTISGEYEDGITGANARDGPRYPPPKWQKSKPFFLPPRNVKHYNIEPITTPNTPLIGKIADYIFYAFNQRQFRLAWYGTAYAICATGAVVIAKDYVDSLREKESSHHSAGAEHH